MKTTLYQNPLIEVRKSTIHGYGVFAKDCIPADTILEELPFITIPEGVAKDYVFLYPRVGTPLSETIGVKSVYALPLGYGCIYNHCDNANSTWYTDTKNELFVFKTQRFVNKDEELCTYYGPESYWTAHPHVNKV